MKYKITNIPAVFSMVMGFIVFFVSLAFINIVSSHHHATDIDVGWAAVFSLLYTLTSVILPTIRIEVEDEDER